jgi:hypothetical protein
MTMMTTLEAFRFIPSLLVATMLLTTPAKAMPTVAEFILCSGGSVPMPAHDDGSCDQACHAACSRKKRR